MDILVKNNKTNEAKNVIRVERDLSIVKTLNVINSHFEGLTGEFRLFHNGNMMSEFSKLRDYDVGEGSTLLVVHANPNAASDHKDRLKSPKCDFCNENRNWADKYYYDYPTNQNLCGDCFAFNHKCGSQNVSIGLVWFGLVVDREPD